MPYQQVFQTRCDATCRVVGVWALLWVGFCSQHDRASLTDRAIHDDVLRDTCPTCLVTLMTHHVQAVLSLDAW